MFGVSSLDEAQTFLILIRRLSMQVNKVTELAVMLGLKVNGGKNKPNPPIMHSLFRVYCAVSTFGSNYCLWSSRVLCHRLCLPGFGDLLTFISADPVKWCPVGSGPSVDSIVGSLQRCLVKVRTLAGTLAIVLAVKKGHCLAGRWTFCPVWDSESSGSGFH